MIDNEFFSINHQQSFSAHPHIGQTDGVSRTSDIWLEEMITLSKRLHGKKQPTF
jgi:hypothetical protein